MGMPRTKDFHNHFSGCTTITVDGRKNAKRIINRCIALGWHFYYTEVEGYCNLTFSENINLTYLQARFPDIKIEIG